MIRMVSLTFVLAVLLLASAAPAAAAAGIPGKGGPPSPGELAPSVPDYLTSASPYVRKKSFKSTTQTAVKLPELPARRGSEAPDTELLDLATSNTIKLSEFRGKVIVLDFWATWCEGCQKPMVALNELAVKHKKEWGDKVVFILASTDKEPKLPLNFLKLKNMDELKQTWIAYDAKAGQSSAMHKYGVVELPLTLLIDKNNRVAWRGRSDEADFEGMVGQLAEQ